MKPTVPILTLSLLLILPGIARPADKSVIIGFHRRPGPHEEALIRQTKGDIKRSYRLIPALAASLPAEQIENLKRDARVAYVEENAVYWTAQKHSADLERNNSWGVRHIFADIAHASGNKGTGVKVAILDTGIDYAHRDLGFNYRGGYDFVFDDNDPFDDSFNSHGTHVAGIVAAEENGTGVVGVAPEAELYAVKVLDGAGFGTEDWIISGIEWAVQNGIKIINLSIEGPHRQGLQDACETAAYDAGILLVAAGGNSLAGGGPVMCPAAYDSVIAVTALDSADRPGYFSPVGEKLELAAPGIRVFSTAADGTYRSLSGTSHAAPHVTGTAALLIRSNTRDWNGDGRVDSDDVRRILQRTATDLGDAGRDTIYGHGLVNAASASFSSEITLVVTGTSAAAGRDAEEIRVGGMPYSITITNRGLTKLVVDVFEGEILRKDLSGTVSFGDRFRFGTRRQLPEKVFALDATGARYRVRFTPYGILGGSAKIVLARGGE